MGRKAKPHSRSGHGHRGWYATVGGKKVHLATGEKEATRAEAEAVFARLTGEADPRVRRVVDVLRERPDLIPAVLRAVEGEKSNPLDTGPVGGLPSGLELLHAAFGTVDWAGAARDAHAGRMRPGADRFIDGRKWKDELLDIFDSWHDDDGTFWAVTVFGKRPASRRLASSVTVAAHPEEPP